MEHPPTQTRSSTPLSLKRWKPCRWLPLLLFLTILGLPGCTRTVKVRVPVPMSSQCPSPPVVPELRSFSSVGDRFLWEQFKLDWALHAMTIQGLKDLAAETRP